MRQEITDAILDFFFHHGKMLKALNLTLITLISITLVLRMLVKFRPISCWNTLYKCIKKMICKRLRLVLPHVIEDTQGAFVHSKHCA